MFNPQDDPLGLGLKQRARENRLSTWALDPANTGQFGFAAPLGDDWDAFFQAVGEATPAGKKLHFTGATDASSPVDPNADAGTLFAAHSNQLRGIDPYKKLGALTSQKKRKV